MRRAWAVVAMAVAAVVPVAGCGADAADRPAGAKVSGWPAGGVADASSPSTTAAANGPGAAGAAVTRPPAPTRLPGVTAPASTTAEVPASVPARPVLDTDRILYLGDSVLAAVGDDDAARARLLRGVAGEIDAQVCRRLVATSCTANGRTPDTAVEAIRRHAGGGFTVAVVEAGYNDLTITDDIDVVMSELRRIGVTRVLWVTYHETAGKFGGHNVDLAAAVRRYPGVLSLVDWRDVSIGRPEWFRGDDLHLTPVGAGALAEVIATGVEAARRGTA